MQAIYKPRDCRKIGWGNWGEKRGTPNAGIPHLHHTARRWAECCRALLCHQGSLEKELHRRYSKTEFYNKEVFHIWEAKVVLFLLKKEKQTKHKLLTWYLWSWAGWKKTVQGWPSLSLAESWGLFSDEYWFSSLEQRGRLLVPSSSTLSSIHTTLWYPTHTQCTHTVMIFPASWLNTLTGGWGHCYP